MPRESPRALEKFHGDAVILAPCPIRTAEGAETIFARAMIVELVTGYSGTATQSPVVARSGTTARTSGAFTPTQSLKRDAQGLAPAGRLALAMGAAKGAAAGAATAQSLLSAAKTGIDAIAAALDDMKVLSETAAEADMSARDRAILHDAFEALRSEIGAIVDRTTYGGVKLLDGDGGASRSFTFTVGSSDGDSAKATVSIAKATAAGLAAGLESASLLTEAGATVADALVDTAIDAAAGIGGVLRAAAGRADAAADVGSRVSAESGAVRSNFLELRATADRARAISQDVAGEAGYSLVPEAAATTKAILDSLPASGGGDGAEDGGEDASRPREKVDIRA
jgi:flagellin-like hook-associated protein FlgL